MSPKSVQIFNKNGSKKGILLLECLVGAVTVLIETGADQVREIRDIRVEKSVDLDHRTEKQKIWKPNEIQKHSNIQVMTQNKIMTEKGGDRQAEGIFLAILAIFLQNWTGDKKNFLDGRLKILLADF